MNRLLENGVRTFIVGGYVRDRLLGLAGLDHDFVVTGATPELMLELGFSQVGANFPVFLHPETNDEYALARSEVKSGHGYHGFEVNFDPSTTLNDDLYRRDFTFNAMAREVVGWKDEGHAILSDDVIDPFGGMIDLINGVVKHVSIHVKDDPVRILRAARFAARYDFDVDESTVVMLKEVVSSGELSHVPRERLWEEFNKAAVCPGFPKFFNLLLDLGVCGEFTLNPIASTVNVGGNISSELARLSVFQDKYEHVVDLMDHINASSAAIRLVNVAFELKQMVKDGTVLSPNRVERWLNSAKVSQCPDRAIKALNLVHVLKLIEADLHSMLLTLVVAWSNVTASSLMTPEQIESIEHPSMIGVKIKEARSALVQSTLGAYDAVSR